MSFGVDTNGFYKLLPDGRVLRIQEREFNTLLSLSMNVDSFGWEEGW